MSHQLEATLVGTSQTRKERRSQVDESAMLESTKIGTFLIPAYNIFTLLSDGLQISERAHECQKGAHAWLLVGGELEQGSKS